MPSHTLGVAQSGRTDPLRVLEEVKRLAVEQLGTMPGLVYAGVQDALDNAAHAETIRPGHFEDVSTLRMLRQQSASLMMRYRQQVAQGFDDFRGLRVRNKGELPLGLIEHDHLEFHLAGQRVAESLGQRHLKSLDTMHQRLHWMTAALGMPLSVNPIGPERLSAAFVETFHESETTANVRELLFRHYEKELDRVIGDLYRRVNQLLADAGYDLGNTGPARGGPRTGGGFVHDTMDSVAYREGAPHGGGHPYGGFGGMPGPQGFGSPQGFGGGHGNGGHAGAGHFQSNGQSGAGSTHPGGGAGTGGYGSIPAAGADGGDGRGSAAIPPGLAQELSELRSLLHVWRDGLQSEHAHAQASTRPQALPHAERRELRVEEVLSVASMLQPEPPDAFARALAGSGRLGDTIRDHLFDGARRLGLHPDQTRFSEKEEDAIDLVALLFDALFRSHSLQDRARRLYARLVLPYVKVALTDDSVFVSGDHPARKLLDAITEACEGNQAATAQDRELLDRAAAASQRIVAEYNEDLAVFELAHAELDALLSQQRRRIELQEQRAVKATMGRERLGCARATADTALRERLGQSRLTQAVADFLAMPWRHHVVQTVLREGDDEARQAEALALGDALVEVDRLAGENRGAELADRLLALEPAIVQCLASSGLDDSAARHGLAGLVHALATPDRPRSAQPPRAAGEEHDDGSDERRLWLAGGTATLGHDEELAERMRSLRPGEWLRVTDTHGEIVQAKVAWISPLTSRYLLVNRRGIRVLVASAEELAVLAGAGRLVVGTERTAFDEAMRQVRKRLDQASGQN